ncbi:MAG: LacI family transcriptional regulator [Rhodobacteraceae bacterium]|jgi:LacI family transcriptional regulator|nr:LacI family transcriptional regulator [Paracoccaceae bacterium]
MTLAPDTDHRPTLKTIAHETGLAVATVSRALKDAPDIGEATKERVRAAATRLGYRPNRAGVRLRTGKTNVIALVLATDTDVMNHTSRLISSLAQELRGTAYHLVMMPFFPDEDPMTPIRYLVETGSADGIIMNQTTADDPRIHYLHAHNVPFATHGRTETGINHPYFDYDNEAFSRAGVQGLASRGRRNLLLIAPPKAHCYAGHMISGFLAETARLGLRAAVADTITSDSGAVAIEAALQNRMALPDRPDGILCGSTTAVMAAVTGAELAGLSIGRDFDVFGKEAIPYLHRFRRQIMVLREDVDRAGSNLAHAIIQAIENPTAPIAQMLDRPAESDWE